MWPSLLSGSRHQTNHRRPWHALRPRLTDVYQLIAGRGHFPFHLLHSLYTPPTLLLFLFIFIYFFYILIIIIILFTLLLRGAGHANTLGAAQHLLQLARLEHSGDDVAAADELALDVHLGDGGPLAVCVWL